MSAPEAPQAPTTESTERSRSTVLVVAGLVVLVVLVALVAGAVGFVLGDRDDDGPMMEGRSVGSGTSERDFLADMTAHHEEAIMMAKELRRSDRPEMRALGERVVSSQTAQVEQMRSWARQWYGTASLDSDYHASSRDLTALEGDALDEAFLADMVPHHMAAVMMSRHLLASGSPRHQQVSDLATAVIDEQTAEITQMRQWLRDWFDEDMMSGGSMMGSSP